MWGLQRAGCSSCNCWFHEVSVELPLTKSNVQRICDVCLDNKETCLSNPCKAKLTSLFFFDFLVKISTPVFHLVPQLIKDTVPIMHDNVKEAITNSLPRTAILLKQKSLS